MAQPQRAYPAITALQRVPRDVRLHQGHGHRPPHPPRGIGRHHAEAIVVIPDAYREQRHRSARTATTVVGDVREQGRGAPDPREPRVSSDRAAWSTLGYSAVAVLGHVCRAPSPLVQQRDLAGYFSRPCTAVDSSGRPRIRRPTTSPRRCAATRRTSASGLLWW
ncbi:hypothetical protein QJS66_14545 [Kocuria rhizophila]|nr:hypothetical protein QJS66_14545 [Kocuria rhizophila]